MSSNVFVLTFLSVPFSSDAFCPLSSSLPLFLLYTGADFEDVFKGTKLSNLDKDATVQGDVRGRARFSGNLHINALTFISLQYLWQKVHFGC